MKQMMIVLVLTMSAAGCLRVKVDPVEVKPITLNVNLKIERQLDDFFAFEQAAPRAAATTSTGASTDVTTGASTQPAAAAK